MFERYTERARRVLFFARYEASQLGSISIETEHLLLGLIREGKGLTSRIFARSHLSLVNVRKEIEGRTVFREKVSTSVEIPFSAETKRVLQLGAEESDRLLHNYIGTEHLLLGILREERSVAASILMEKGIRLQTVRDDIVQLLSDRVTVADAPPAPYGPPRIPPSYELHVSRSQDAARGHVTSAGPEYWTASGFTLRSVLARLFRVEESRVVLPGELDRDDRYDVALRLPAPEPQPAVEHRVRQGIERHFRISITRESREEDVYALTSSAGAHLARQRQNEDSGGGVSTGSFEFSTMATEDVPTSVPGREQRASFGNMMMSGITMDDLCRMLEEMFGKRFLPT